MITAFVRPLLPWAVVFGVIGLLWSHGYMYRRGMEVQQARCAEEVRRAADAEAKREADALKQLRARLAQEKATHAKLLDQLRAAALASDWDTCRAPAGVRDGLRDAYERYGAGSE